MPFFIDFWLFSKSEKKKKKKKKKKKLSKIKISFREIFGFYLFPMVFIFFLPARVLMCSSSYMVIVNNTTPNPKKKKNKNKNNVENILLK